MCTKVTLNIETWSWYTTTKHILWRFFWTGNREWNLALVCKIYYIWHVLKQPHFRQRHMRSCLHIIHLGRNTHHLLTTDSITYDSHKRRMVFWQRERHPLDMPLMWYSNDYVFLWNNTLLKALSNTTLWFSLSTILGCLPNCCLLYFGYSIGANDKHWQDTCFLFCFVFCFAFYLSITIAAV